ncbi:MAG TPA: hypothetical protein VFP56_05925 [Candidatus Limnocylindrales bacterium]|nr:hypothetical protein [Candidatus Limnocylindrales bacterium]
MAMSPRLPAAGAPQSRLPALRRWPDWSPYAAALVSAVYAVLGVSWAAAGGTGFPFGEGRDPVASASILRDVPPDAGARGLALAGIVGLVVALGMTRPGAPSPVRWLLLGLGVMASLVLAIVIPDYRVLVLVAYTPIVILGAPFGWPPETNLLGVLSWSVIHQLVFILGGVLFAATTLAFWRRWHGSCASCGRGPDRSSWAAPERAASWGRRATYVAAAVPLVYAATRWAWALGIPLGISEEFLRQGQEVGLWLAGAALATVAVVGAILTLGLTQSWGEAIPSWVPILGGRRVPPALVTVPAGVVAVVVTSAGVMFWRLVLAGGFTLGTGQTLTLEDSWAALAPELLWPVWGVALGIGALGYHLRRRGRCAACGRGRSQPEPAA